MPKKVKRKKARVIWAVLYDDGSIHVTSFRKFMAYDIASDCNATNQVGRTFSVVKFVECRS